MYVQVEPMQKLCACESSKSHFLVFSKNLCLNIAFVSKFYADHVLMINVMGIDN